MFSSLATITITITSPLLLLSSLPSLVTAYDFHIEWYVDNKCSLSAGPDSCVHGDTCAQDVDGFLSWNCHGNYKGANFTRSNYTNMEQCESGPTDGPPMAFHTQTCYGPLPGSVVPGGSLGGQADYYVKFCDCSPMTACVDRSKAGGGAVPPTLPSLKKKIDYSKKTVS